MNCSIFDECKIDDRTLFCKMTQFVINKVVCQDFWPKAAGRQGQLKFLEVCELWEASLSCFKNQNYHPECKKL